MRHLKFNNIMIAIKLLMIVIFFASLGMSLHLIIEIVSFAKIVKKDEPTAHENKLKSLSYSIVFVSLFWTIFYVLNCNLF